MPLLRQAPSIFKFLIALLAVGYVSQSQADVPRRPRDEPQPDHQYFAIQGKQGFTLSLEGGATKRCFIRPLSDFDEAACAGIDTASAEQVALNMQDQGLLTLAYLRYEGYVIPTTILGLDDLGEVQPDQVKEVAHLFLAATQGAKNGTQISDEQAPQTALTRINGLQVISVRMPISVPAKNQQRASLAFESYIVFVDGRTFVLTFLEAAAHRAECEKAVREIMSTIGGNPTSKKYNHADQAQKSFVQSFGYYAGALLALIMIGAIAVRLISSRRKSRASNT